VHLFMDIGRNCIGQFLLSDNYVQLLNKGENDHARDN